MTAPVGRLEAVAARLAALGFEVHELDDDGAPVFLVRRWGLLRELDTVAEVEAFADRVGAHLRVAREAA